MEFYVSDFTFSEHGEDILIHRLMLWKEHGFYVDCGAYHARDMSLTARLRSFGWTGIDIDPQVVQRLQKDLPGTQTLCAAIGLDEGAANFFRYADPVLNTVCPKQHAHLQAIEQSCELFTRHLDSKEIRTTTIARLLKEQNILDMRIDFLNLDIEGMELMALQGFP